MKKHVLTLLVLLCLLMPMTTYVCAADDGYIFETTGVLLNGDEAAALDRQCADAAAACDCGIYVVVLVDHRAYHEDPLTAAETIYRDMDFGVGENKNGILLMLSMAERDYAMVCYGDIANSVFTDRVQDSIADDFLDDFSVNNWDGGLSDFVSNSAEALASFDGTVGESYPGHYEDGVYEQEPSGPAVLYVLGKFGWMIALGSVAIALGVCLVMKNGMKTARKAVHANQYIPRGGVELRISKDIFTHTTTQVIHHESPSGGSGGGTSVRSSGFSGRSGKF